jgi:hypothetical protein
MLFARLVQRLSSLQITRVLQFVGNAGRQVVRRLRSTLLDLVETVPVLERRLAVQRYLEHLKLSVERHIPDLEDQQMAMQEDRQGLGLSRNRKVNAMV